jgi:phosphatidylethanolamine-binding protein (PEBP) family uncharacterized protein
LSRKNPSVAEWLHWLVVNIPASNILEGINGGQHQQPYGWLVVFECQRFSSVTEVG